MSDKCYINPFSNDWNDMFEFPKITHSVEKKFERLSKRVGQIIAINLIYILNKYLLFFNIKNLQISRKKIGILLKFLFYKYV